MLQIKEQLGFLHVQFLLPLLLVVVVLGGVGAYVINQSKAVALQISGPAIIGANGVPSGYNKCADENGVCVINGTYDFLYGANNMFVVKPALKSNVSCNNSSFGDPIPYTAKSCYIRVSKTNNNPINSDYIFCANEGQYCNLSGVSNVVFGSNGYYAFKSTISSSILCGSGEFGGDPNPFYAKQCWYQAQPTFTPSPTQPSGPYGYRYCVAEGGTCVGATALFDVAYGADYKFAYKTGVSGSIACNNATFGDPAPNIAKACYYKAIETAAAKCTIIAPSSMAIGSNPSISVKVENIGATAFSTPAYVSLAIDYKTGPPTFAPYKDFNVPVLTTANKSYTYSTNFSSIVGFKVPKNAKTITIIAATSSPSSNCQKVITSII